MDYSKTQRSHTSRSSTANNTIDWIIQQCEKVTLHRDIISLIVKRLNRIKIIIKEKSDVDGKIVEHVLVELHRTCTAFKEFLQQEDVIYRSSGKKLDNAAKKYIDTFLNNILSRLVKQEVDLTQDHQAKIQIYSEAISEQQAIKHTTLDEEIRKRIREAGDKMKINAQKRLLHLTKQYSHITGPYLTRCFELYSTIVINGLDAQVTGEVAQNYYEISSYQRNKFECAWKSFKMPLKYMPIQLRIDSSTSFERNAARQMVMTDHHDLRTLLFKEAPVGTWRQRLLVAPYMPSMLERDRLSDNSKSQSAALEDVLQQHRWIVMLGDPGSGKTSFVQWLCTKYIRAAENVQENFEFGPFRMPIVIRIGEFADALRKKQNLTLFEHIGEHKWFGRSMLSRVDSSKISERELAMVLQDYVREGHALIILDGLDEIVVSQERMRLVNLVETFVETYVQTPSHRAVLDDCFQVEILDEPGQLGGNQLIVTSRIVGYHAAPLGGRFAHYIIEKLDTERISGFIDNWFKTVHAEMIRVIRKVDTSVHISNNKWEGQAKFLKVELSNPDQIGLKELSSNPCLLSFICSIAFSSKESSLPSQRILLYEKTVNAMLDSWKNKETNDTTIQGSKVIRIFCDIAWYIHMNSAAGLIEENRLKELCVRSLQVYEGKKAPTAADELRVEKDAEDFVQIVRRDVGVLAERGESFYGFLHLTFQEYFVCLDLTNVTKQRHSIISPDGKVLDDVQVLIHSLHRHMNDPRFRVPIALAFGRLSSKWKKKPETLDRLCYEFLKTDSTSFFPINALFVINNLSDFVQRPSLDVLIIALNQLLKIATKEKWANTNPALHSQIKDAIHKLPDNDISKWVRSILATSHNQFNHSIPTLCSLLVRQSEDSFEIRGIDASTCESLISFLKYDDEDNNFAIDMILMQIAYKNHRLLPTIPTGLKALLIREKVDFATIHPSILAVIIIIYGGLKRYEDTVMFDVSRMYRESNFLTPLLIGYFSTKNQTHDSKIVFIERQCVSCLSTVINSDNQMKAVDALVTMLCLFGVSKLWTLSSLSSTTVFSAALVKLKRTSMILRQFYMQSSTQVAADVLTTSVNDHLSNECNSKPKNNQSKATDVIAYTKAMTSALARLRSSKKSIIVLSKNEEHGLTFPLPKLLRDQAIFEQLLRKNMTLSSNQLSCKTLPEFARLFWILNDDETTDTQYRMAVAADTIPTFLLVHSNSDPIFALTFVADHLRPLYCHLLEQYQIILNNSSTESSKKQPFLLFQHILIQSIMELSESSCKRLSLTLALCAMLPVLRMNRLENVAIGLASKLNTDNNYRAMIEYTKQRPVDSNTGEYTDGLGDFPSPPEDYEIAYNHQKTIRMCIEEERQRLQVAMRLLNEKNKEVNANSQLYSASVSLSYLCWFSGDTELSRLFAESLNAVDCITDPLLRFDALCALGVSPQGWTTSYRLKNGRTLMEELEKQLVKITSDLHCTLHAAVLLRCCSSRLQKEMIEKSLRDLLKKVTKADQADQLVINSALFGILRSDPLVATHLIQFLQKSKLPMYDICKELFQSKSSIFQRFFANQNFINNTLLASMFIVELTSETHLILEWLNSTEIRPSIDPSLKTTGNINEKIILIHDNLTLSQAISINRMMQPIGQSPNKQDIANIKCLVSQLHSVSMLELEAREIAESWLNLEVNPTLNVFAWHAALLLLKSNYWSPRAVRIAADLLLCEQDRFRQRAESVFLLNNNDHIQTSTQLTLEVILQLHEYGSLLCRKSAYAALMLLRKHEHIEIDQRSHLDALLYLEKQRILLTNNKTLSNAEQRLPSPLNEIFDNCIRTNNTEFSFIKTTVKHFSSDVIEYVVELIEDGFNKFWKNEISRQNIQQRELREKFIERVLLSLHCILNNSKCGTSKLVESLADLISNNSSDLIRKAAIFTLGFSKNEDTLSIIFTIIELVARDLSDTSHGYSDELISTAIRSYCYNASTVGYDVSPNGEIETLQRLLDHPSVIVSTATIYGLGRILDVDALMKILSSNCIQCYKAFIAGTSDSFLHSASTRCVKAAAALIEQHPDLLPILIQELYEHIRYFTDVIFNDVSVEYLYNYSYPHYANVAAVVAESMPAAFCTAVNDFVNGENLKRSLYYTSKQHHFPRRAACLTVLSVFGELTAELCEMLIRALLDDPSIQNTCYRCLSRIQSVKDEKVIVKIKEYLRSKSMNARYVSCKLLLILSRLPNTISLDKIQKLFNDVMRDPESDEDLWLIVEQDDIFCGSIYYNAGKLKNVVYALLVDHFISSGKTGTTTMQKEAATQSILQQDFIASEKAARLAACLFKST
ncbi:unnamed protein product [Adineta ricciae]|uniref:NACHT domain-containing protein n=1 Tax=Adineta ricciae TaxID=249248 RepID=A0A815J2N7_ADIRI|nr:unnamed protein product [Adineta ricciae]CAF1374752.1 unnamed protein product [Adineta ricciae]